MRSKPVRIGSWCWLALLAWPAHAFAVPEFRREIQQSLKLDYEPPCSVCHVKDKTGSGTAQTPFALSMRQHGLAPDQRGSASRALTGLKNDNVDSDGDAIPDVDELMEGTDPNVFGPVPLKDRVEPSWGCSALPGRAGSVVWASLAAIAGLFAAYRRSARRRERQRK